MYLSVITPERTIYDGDIDQVTLQTTEGEITVLPHHIPYVAELRAGELRIVRGGKEEPMACAGGFIEVLRGRSIQPTADSRQPQAHPQDDTHVAILADDAMRVEEMDIAAIEQAQERARKALEEKRGVDDTAFAAAAAALERELAKVRVARKYRGRRGS